MIYYTGDLHLGSRDLLYLDDRPFKSCSEQNKVILENFGSLTKKDKLYILGDALFSASYRSLKALSEIPAKKYLIVGNHDEELLNPLEVADIFEEITGSTTIRDKGRLVFLSHYPHAEWPGMYKGVYHLFAHLHATDNEAQRFMSTKPTAFNVGCMLHGYAPVTLDDLIARSKDTYEYVQQDDRDVRVAKVRVGWKATKTLTNMATDIAYSKLVSMLERDATIDASTRSRVAKALRANEAKVRGQLKDELQKALTPRSDIFCVEEVTE